MKRSKALTILRNGLLDENPTFRLVMGMCPTLAITTSVANGFGMGMAATFVLIFSNLFISMLRNFIPSKVRIPAYVVIIATFVTMAELFLEAYAYSLYESLGVFIPLIVVNCIILARAEAFASKNTPLYSALDGLAMGLGFTGALVIISAIREILGSGTILGFHLFGANFQPALMVSSAPGGFITLGLILGFINWMTNRKGGNKE
ncbi:MAG: electron transport complex subunit E [Eubacteriales bacterium]|nr:electron transport complex subunit E [Eubacteriales bacterium]